MSHLKEFDYKGKKIRVVLKNGEPWWVLADICKVLGLKNPTRIARTLDDNERSKLNLERKMEVNVINESGLYTLIIRSDKPESKPLKKWVTSEVLPTIRKNEYNSLPNRLNIAYEIFIKVNALPMDTQNCILSIVAALECAMKSVEINR